MTYLLDSVILIDHFRGVTQATDFLESIYGQACTSIVTRAEVLAGFDDEETRTTALPLLDTFPLLEFGRQEADLAGRLRRQFRWKLPDAMQAAVAQQHELRLATRNTKDFNPDRHAFVLIPYTLP